LICAHLYQRRTKEVAISGGEVWWIDGGARGVRVWNWQRMVVAGADVM